MITSTRSPALNGRDRIVSDPSCSTLASILNACICASMSDSPMLSPQQPLVPERRPSLAPRARLEPLPIGAPVLPAEQAEHKSLVRLHARLVQWVDTHQLTFHHGR